MLVALVVLEISLDLGYLLHKLHKLTCVFINTNVYCKFSEK